MNAYGKDNDVTYERIFLGEPLVPLLPSSENKAIFF